jgi:hypothetical protein
MGQAHIHCKNIWWARCDTMRFSTAFRRPGRSLTRRCSDEWAIHGDIIWITHLVFYGEFFHLSVCLTLAFKLSLIALRDVVTRITPSTMENGVANPGQGGGRRVLHYSTPIWNSFPFPSGHLFCCLGVEGTARSSSVVPCNQLSCPAQATAKRALTSPVPSPSQN